MLAAYGLALPAAVLIRSIVASFYAATTPPPVVASLTAVAVNVGLKVVLTGVARVMGLALATAAGVWVNVLILFCLAYGRGGPRRAAR